jgi:hypothetical protein
MSDDLVKRLRNWPLCKSDAFEDGKLVAEAADRIEALEAIIQENVAQDGQPIIERMATQRARINELEAALRKIADYDQYHVPSEIALRALEGKL